jgi:hypothetical protein
MIVCRKCSRRHADGTEFCTCGAFLEFEGEHLPDEAPTAPAAPVAPATPGAPPPADPPVQSWSVPTAPAPPVTGPAEPSPWSGFGDDGSAPVRAPSSAIDAQLPDAPIAPSSHEPVWVSPTARPGDVVCRQCGTPNAPDRQFCHHCGHPLAVTSAMPTAAPVRVPWWRRIGRRARSHAPDPLTAASTVHRASRGGLGWRSLAFRTGGVLVIVAGVLALLGPWRGTVVARAKDVIGAQRYEVISADDIEVEAVASSSAMVPEDFPLQPAESVIDDYANTAWATRWLIVGGAGMTELSGGDAACSADVRTDSFLRFGFDEVDLARVRILGGRHAEDERRTAFSRPLIVELRVDDECTLVELPDDGELLATDFEHDDVEQVELRVLGIYPGEESPATVEISAVVFERGG